jgi:hypothetical protein
LNEGAGSTIPHIRRIQFPGILGILKEFNINFYAPVFANYVHFGRFGAGEIKALPEKVLKQTPEYNLRGCVPS